MKFSASTSARTLLMHDHELLGRDKTVQVLGDNVLSRTLKFDLKVFTFERSNTGITYSLFPEILHSFVLYSNINFDTGGNIVLQIILLLRTIPK